ncbi:hypothetical protein [Paenibacillus daejeonensis]|nr:hypothetical protein [Paenibacillus daejeonensis]
MNLSAANEAPLVVGAKQGALGLSAAKEAPPLIGTLAERSASDS